MWRQRVKSSMAGTVIPRVSPSIQAQPQSTPRWRRDLPLVLASLPLILFLLLPLLALVARVSPTSVVTNIATREVVQAISLSFATTLVTTFIAIVSGTPLAYLLARRQFR